MFRSRVNPISEASNGDTSGTRRKEIGATRSGPFQPGRLRAVLSNGRWLASGDWDGTVILWDVAERRRLFRFVPGGGKITSLAFRNDGQLLGIGAEFELSLWRLNARGQPTLLKRHPTDRARVAFVPGTTRIAVGEGSNRYSNNGAGEALIWDYVRDEVIRRFPGSGGKLALTADGRTLFTRQV